jgi:hypothetical protein
MGGALEALGADISTTSTNPAAIGMFRHSTISGSIGVVSQQEANTYDGLSKTNFSFDQLGFVYSMQTNRTSFLNLAFNYHKSRNFDQILSAAHQMNSCFYRSPITRENKKTQTHITIFQVGICVSFQNSNCHTSVLDIGISLDSGVLLLIDSFFVMLRCRGL